jgi:hypothetical protein
MELASFPDISIRPLASGGELEEAGDTEEKRNIDYKETWCDFWKGQIATCAVYAD